MCPRNLSTAAQSCASKLRSEPLVEFFVLEPLPFFTDSLPAWTSYWLASWTLANGGVAEKMKIGAEASVWLQNVSCDQLFTADALLFHPSNRSKTASKPSHHL